MNKTLCLSFMTIFSNFLFEFELELLFLSKVTLVLVLLVFSSFRLKILEISLITSSNENLSLSSILSILLIISLISSETSPPNSISPISITLSKTFSFSLAPSINGIPFSISYHTTPKLQTSLLNPETLPCRTSGAAYLHNSGSTFFLWLEGLAMRKFFNLIWSSFKKNVSVLKLL